MSFKNKFNLRPLSPVKPLGWIVFAIPFLAMFTMIGSNELNYRTRTEYRLEITGYDPRDLLTGHYIAFRYNWPEKADNGCAQHGECYACLSGAGEKPQLSFTPDKNAPQCDATLALGKYGAANGLPAQPNGRHLFRYNVSEIQAPVLDRMLRERNGKFEVGVVVYPDHTGQLKGLYIDGQHVSEFFK